MIIVILSNKLISAIRQNLVVNEATSTTNVSQLLMNPTNILN